jgi:Raf kinase inhibitor-like YbhB/YbcL family protein
MLARHTARSGLVSVTALAVLALGGCGGSGGAGGSAPRPSRTTLFLQSSAFTQESTIPRQYTCDGENVSPPLTWTQVPVRARSLALLVEDVDAPGGHFLHWSLYELARGSSGLSPGRVPAGAAQGQNSFGSIGYSGPCPPKGDPRHRYVFRLYALDSGSGLSSGATPEAVRQAISEHEIAMGTLTGYYRR